MCCGSGRMAYRMTVSQPRAAVPRQSVPPPASAPAPVPADPVASPPVPAPGRSTAVSLRYLGVGSRRIIGPVTGLAYDVSAAQPVLAMEPRDAAVLLRQGVFARA